MAWVGGGCWFVGAVRAVWEPWKGWMGCDTQEEHLAQRWHGIERNQPGRLAHRAFTLLGYVHRKGLAVAE